MQGASPLASPGAEPGRHGGRWRFPHPGGVCPLRRRLNLPPQRPRGVWWFWLPADSAFSLLSCPPSPDPLPQWGRGCPKVYFAGGFAPGTPALNRLRHVQTLPSRHPAGWRFFTARIPAAPAGANALFNAQKPVFRKHSQCRAPPSLGDARGEAPCIRKQ